MISASLCIWLAAIMFAPRAVGAETPPPVSEESLRAKLREIDQKLEELAALKAELLKLLAREEKPAPPKPAAAKPWTEKVKLDGYFQMDYLDTTSNRGELQMRRARVNVRGNPSERSRFRIELAGDQSAVSVREMWLERRLDELWSVRGGQFALPFGYELAESDAELVPLERTRAVTLPFADRYDNGLVLTRKAQDHAPEFNLWVVNGQGRKIKEDDHGKNVGARVNWHTKWGQAGMSYQDGSYINPTTKIKTDRNALGVHAVYRHTPWTLSGEFVTGEALGADVEGWYTQAIWRLPRTPGEFFVRREGYDPDTDRGGDYFWATLFGYAHDLDDKTRLTVQWQDAKDGGRSADEWGFEWQQRF